MDLLKRFEEDSQLRNLAANTIQSNLWYIKKYLDYVDGRPLDDKEIIKGYLAYIRGRRLKQSTIRRTFSVITTFYSFLVEEETVFSNPVQAIRKRYLHVFKEPQEPKTVLSIQDAGRLVASIMDTRDRAMLMMLFKTGLRRKELLELDINDLNFNENIIKTKPTAKRTNRIVFFDEETARTLRRWLRLREDRQPKTPALWVNRWGGRG